MQDRFTKDYSKTTQSFYDSVKEITELEKKAFKLKPHKRYTRTKVQDGYILKRILPYNHPEEVEWRRVEVINERVRNMMRASKSKELAEYRNKPLSYRIGYRVTRGLAYLGL